jgi:hypothetical protein
MSTVYAVTRRLLSLPALLLRRDVSKDAELLALRHENAVLRRHVPRVRYEPADRLWFATLSHLIPRRRWAQVFPITPRHAAGLAPQTRNEEVGLQPATPTRTPAHGHRGQSFSRDGKWLNVIPAEGDGPGYRVWGDVDAEGEDASVQ